MDVLYILNILKKYSDEDHIISSHKIEELIKEEYNEQVSYKTIQRYIDNLINKFNYDITKTPRGYYITKDPSVEFEDGELSAIINTFAYSNFIPDKMSNEIINKCLNMMSIYEQDKYKNYKAIMKNTKTDNLEIIKNIEDINEAIYKQRKIKFDYSKYILIEKRLDRSTKVCVVSPYKLIYALQKLYLICMDEKTKKLCQFRLDKMNDIEISKYKINNKFSDGDIEFYIKSNVNMISGDLEKVEIECDNSILDMVVETYGKDIQLQELPNNKFYAKFYTTLKGFKYWCLRNYDTVKVVSPKSLINDINKLVKENY